MTDEDRIHDDFARSPEPADFSPPDERCGARAQLSFYEFFAGAGMARAGLGEDWRCLFANDIDARKGAAYAANFGPCGLKVGDVARLGPADLPGHADLAWASFPCQDLSLAGDRAGLEGARSGTFWSFWRLMEGLRREGRSPRIVVVENVLGLLTSHDGKDFAALVDALVEGGYQAGALAIDAAFWVPQSRSRVFVIAVDAVLPIPHGLVADKPSPPFHLRALIEAHKRLSPASRSAWLWFALEAPAKRNIALVDIVEDQPTGVAWHARAETDRLLALMSPVNIAKVDAARSSGARAVGAVFRRMRPGEDGADASGQRVQRAEIRFDLAGCLRVPSGGSSRQTIIIIDGDTVRSRLLSPREAARLMGLSDDYKLPANVNEALGLMGDGVVAPVVQHLAANILEPILRWVDRAGAPIDASVPESGRNLPPPTSPGSQEGGAGKGQGLPGNGPVADAPARVGALDALAGVAVVYCAETPQAHRLLTEMLATDWVAIDIETAPNKTEVDRLAGLLQRKAETAGLLKAARKLKAPAAEIATYVASGKRLATEIRYAQTAGLDPHRARIRLLQVYAGGDHVLVIDLERTGAGVLELIDGARVIAHNIAFELAFLEAANVALGGMQCTLQAVRLTLGEHATSLAAAARAYLNVDLDKSLQTSDWNAPHLSPEQIDYAAIDAVVAWRIAEKILPRFEVQRSAYEIQIGAVPAAMRMEQRGFKLDMAAHARLIADLGEERLAAAREYHEACVAGDHAALADKAPSTPTQKEDLLKALLSSDELKRWRRTEKSGALSTKRSELMRAGHYPPILALAKLSRIDKMLSSFGRTLAALVSPVTGRIHAHYRIASTASGRASCAGPNLQQVPRDPRFRALFVPEPGCVFVIADYSSMELRAAAYISSDHAMTKAFEQGLDLHRLTASQMTGKAFAEVADEKRKGAKCVNFGSVYGQGAGGLVQTAWDQFDIVLDFNEAKAWLKAFESAYWGFVQWRRIHYRRCEGRRYIVIGRDMSRGIGRIYPQSRVPEGGSFYTRCCNLPVQGACADASMLALAYVDDRLFDAEIEGGPVAWLHDEIVLEVRDDQAGLAAEILKQAMIDGFIETFPDAPIDGLVEPHIGMSWAEKS